MVSHALKAAAPLWWMLCFQSLASLWPLTNWNSLGASYLQPWQMARPLLPWPFAQGEQQGVGTLYLSVQLTTLQQWLEIWGHGLEGEELQGQHISGGRRCSMASCRPRGAGPEPTEPSSEAGRKATGARLPLGEEAPGNQAADSSDSVGQSQVEGDEGQGQVFLGPGAPS